MFSVHPFRWLIWYMIQYVQCAPFQLANFHGAGTCWESAGKFWYRVPSTLYLVPGARYMEQEIEKMLVSALNYFS